MRNFRLFLFAAGLLPALQACASLQGEPSDSRSEFTRSRGEAAIAGQGLEGESQSGFLIVGEDFQSRLTFDARPGGPVAAFRHAPSGDEMLAGELNFGEPWLDGGVRRYVGESAGGAPVEVVLEAGPCRHDGAHYGRFARVKAGPEVYTGCARELGPRPRWSEDIAAFLPAVEPCLRDARTSAMVHVGGAGAARVVHARQDGRSVTLRFEYPGSGRFDCRWEGDRIEWRVVPGSHPPLPGEADPVFVPARLPDGLEGCNVHERVRDGEGLLLGALAYDACRGGQADASSADGFG